MSMHIHSVVSDSTTPWNVAHQVPLSMGFFRQEYWSRLPFPPPDLPDPGIKRGSPVSSALAVDSLPLSHLGSPAVLTVFIMWYITSLALKLSYNWKFVSFDAPLLQTPSPHPLPLATTNLIYKIRISIFSAIF